MNRMQCILTKLRRARAIQPHPASGSDPNPELFALSQHDPRARHMESQMFPYVRKTVHGYSSRAATSETGWPARSWTSAPMSSFPLMPVRTGSSQAPG